MFDLALPVVPVFALALAIIWALIENHFKIKEMTKRITSSEIEIVKQATKIETFFQETQKNIEKSNQKLNDINVQLARQNVVLDFIANKRFHLEEKKNDQK
jgi:uncharacterized protein YoxC